MLPLVVCGDEEFGDVRTNYRDKLRYLLVSSMKEASFRKVLLCKVVLVFNTSFPCLILHLQVVQATMIRERQHGPVVELNRIALRRSRATGKSITSKEHGWNATVFAQMTQKLSLLTYDVLMVRTTLANSNIL